MFMDYCIVCNGYVEKPKEMIHLFSICSDKCVDKWNKHPVEEQEKLVNELIRKRNVRNGYPPTWGAYGLICNDSYCENQGRLF
jgi:hypothetical protein